MIKHSLNIAAAVLLLAAAAAAQQNNLQVLVPPSVDVSREKTRDISLGYSSVGGSRINAGCLDLNTVFAAWTSSGVYSGAAIGTALVGGAGPERIYLGDTKKDINGVTIHGSGFSYRLYGGGDYPRRMLFTSVPLSFGSFTIGNNNKEEVSVYNILAGFQAGGGLNFRTGKFMLTPSAMISLMGGYREKYKGGVYYSNLNSGWVKPFAVLTLAADLLYMPRQFKLSAAWQRAFSSGEDRATDTAMLQLSLGWESWGRRKENPSNEKR